MPLATFAAAVKGTEEEVWLKWLQIKHGAERHSLVGWRGLIDRYGNLPAYRGELR